MPTLFDPIKLGALTAPNRIIMAPLTRIRVRLELAESNRDFASSDWQSTGNFALAD